MAPNATGSPLTLRVAPGKWVFWPHLQRDAPRSWPCPLPSPCSLAQSSSARVHPQGVPSHTCTMNMLRGPRHHSPAQSLGVSLKLSPREPPAAVDKGELVQGGRSPASPTPPSDLLTLGQCFGEEAAPGTLYTASPPSDSPSRWCFHYGPTLQVSKLRPSDPQGPPSLAARWRQH